MSIITPKPINYIGPTTAIELATSIGAELNEGVQVALFPSEPEEAALGPAFAYAPGTTGAAVTAKFQSWGTRLLDIVLEGKGANRGVKWWKVRDYARATKLDIVPVAWQGPIAEIPGKYFVAGLGVRFFNAGPWFFPIKGNHMEDNLQVIKTFLGA